MTRSKFLASNTTMLAFIGDAVYEVQIRNHVLKSGEVRADLLHKAAVKYVRAEAQAGALKAMMPGLSEEEVALVKRARNKKITSKPKNAEPMEYKMATAFEALIGALYMAEDHQRISQLIEQAILHIDAPPV
jgi:ribonuclease III family protein